MNFDGGHAWLRWLRPDADEAERRLDEQLDDSFPASDPPSHTPLRAQHRGFFASALRGIGNARRHDPPDL